MSALSPLQAALFGLVEGITEFLPISSTGHLILLGSALGLDDEGTKTFEVVIQLGAILAVVWIYRARFLDLLRRAADPSIRRFVLNLALAFLPAAVLGFLFHHAIKALLFRPLTVALALILGGVAILLIEARKPRTRVAEVDGLSPPLALGIGLAQCLSLVPGVSRSGATILGGFALGVSRTAATEFSFFLAVPTMLCATVYDLFANRAALSASDLPAFVVGFAVAFVSALLVIRALVRFVAQNSFRSFAWYRIALGLVTLGWSLANAS
jgi:undecaprenyl-diphosphatase